MQIRINKTLLFILLFSIAGLNANAQQQFDKKKLQQYLDIQKERLDFSGTIIVSSSGKFIFSASTGKSSIELNVPVSASTVFPVASITKSFTVTLIAASERKLTLSEGTYAATNGTQLTLAANNGKLFAKLGNNPPFELFQESSLKFYGKKVPVDFIFELDNSGKAKEIISKGMGRQFSFTRK